MEVEVKVGVGLWLGLGGWIGRGGGEGWSVLDINAKTRTKNIHVVGQAVRVHTHAPPSWNQNTGGGGAKCD